MNKKLDEFVEQQLSKFPDKDVLVYYERGEFKITHGFFTWNGHSHTRTTISELIKDGFEKSDIKELRDESKKIFIVEQSFDKFEVSYG